MTPEPDAYTVRENHVSVRTFAGETAWEIEKAIAADIADAEDSGYALVRVTSVVHDDRLLVILHYRVE